MYSPDSRVISPCFKKGTILVSPFLVTEFKAKIGLPRPSTPRAAPRKKSIWPPTPGIRCDDQTKRQKQKNKKNNKNNKVIYEMFHILNCGFEIK